MDLNLPISLTVFILIISSAHSSLTTNSASAASASTRSGNQATKASCGFPGSPKDGRVLHLLEKYEEGMVVTFECDVGFYLLGSMTRTCLSNGTWSGSMPVCDQSVKALGLTSASEALLNYPPQLAADGNFRTCFFSNRRKPRWWRVELPKQTLLNQSIISVALTLPPIHADLHFSIYVIETNEVKETSNETANDVDQTNSAPNSSKYHKCASFRGVFSSKTIVIQCAKGGLKGNYLQIEDDYPQLEYFGLCEVDIFVERDSYECGPAEVPSNGYVLAKSNQSTEIEYSCNDGFKLVGEPNRSCDRKTGQWSGSEPYCERITCSAPTAISNGFYRVFGDHQEVPVVGTRTVYECAPGYLLVGVNDTRQCDATGEWSGQKPYCEAIDCNHPETLLVNIDDFMLYGAQFRLLNSSTKYSAIAELICPFSESVHRGSNHTSRPNLTFRCREDGIWTEINLSASNETGKVENGGFQKAHSCVRQRHNGMLYFFNTGHKGAKLRKSFYFRDNSVNMLHFLAAVVVTAFICILIIIVLLFKRQIIEWPDNLCSPFSDRAKAFGQTVKQGASNMFAQVQSFFRQKLSQQTGDESTTKEPSFTITASVSDIESARGRDEPSAADTVEEVKEFETNFSSFYDEIKNAARQVFSEDTDRKLLRAARIAAELDVIKSQYESNYHWIYPPTQHTGSSSLPPSLNPSVHESSHIPSSGQIYAKVDLIRKHRYRREKDSSTSSPMTSPITSVYQVPPRPRHMAIDPNSSLISQSNGCTVYQLRKAISSPEAVFVEGEYATIRRLRLDQLASANYNGGGGAVALDQTPILAQQINPIPIQTLL